MDGHDRRPRSRPRLQAAARLLLRALALRQGLRGSGESPFTVDCTIRPEAKWSDGVAITADDFKFTFDTIMNPKNNVVTRNGYDKILAFNVISPTEFQMVFKEIFAPFRDLWAGTSTLVLPKHVLEGKNFNKVWNTLHLRPEDEEADRQRPDARAVVQTRPADHPGAEPELLGKQGIGRRRSCSSRSPTATARSTRSAPVRST